MYIFHKLLHIFVKYFKHTTKMKRLILIFLSLSMGTGVFAQFRLSVRNGVIFSLLTEYEGKVNQSLDNDYYYTPEVAVSYKFKNQFSISTGYQYQRVGFNTAPQIHIAGDEDLIYEYQYNTIPLYAEYSVYQNKFFFTWIFGTKLSFKNDMILRDSDRKSRLTNIYSNANTFVPSLLIGTRIGYLVFKHYSLDLSFRYNIPLTAIEGEPTQDAIDAGLATEGHTSTAKFHSFEI